MEITEILKKIRLVEADRNYSMKSKGIILSSEKEGLAGLNITARGIIIGVIRSGWTTALTAAFLFLAIGGFSILKIFSPATTAVVDITGLRAEAQAIDTQIELTNIAYNASLNIENETSTAAMALPSTKQTMSRKAGNAEQNISATEDAAAQMTIDSFLDALSK